MSMKSELVKNYFVDWRGEGISVVIFCKKMMKKKSKVVVRWLLIVEC